MPYVVKEARRMAEAALDIPNPPEPFRAALDDLLRVIQHPLAVPIERITETYSVDGGKVTATKSTASKRRGGQRKPTLTEKLMEIE